MSGEQAREDPAPEEVVTPPPIESAAAAAAAAAEEATAEDGVDLEFHDAASDAVADAEEVDAPPPVTGVTGELIKEGSFHITDYELTMSETLPEFNEKLDYDEAAMTWQAAAVTDKNGKYISVMSSTYADLEPLGTGVGLWFRTLKSLAWYFSIMSIAVGFMLWNYLHLYYNNNSDLDEDQLDALARFTIGVVAASSQTESIFGWDERTVMLTISALDCFAIILFVILIKVLKAWQTRYIDENDDAVTSLPDYTVQVWGIPIDATKNEVEKHFKQFGAVADCVVVKDFGSVMGARMQRAKHLKKLKMLKFDAAFYAKHNRPRALAGQLKRCERMRVKVRKCDARIAMKLMKGFDSVCAFVTFEDATHRADAVNAYKGGLLFRLCQKKELKLRDGQYTLTCTTAPEASDVLWENVLRVSVFTQLFRRLITFTLTVVLLAAAVGVVVYAKDQVEKSPPSVSCAGTVKSAENPAPKLECAAIWDLAGSGTASVNATDPARAAVSMFVDNVQQDKCKDYISGVDWALPMGRYAPYADAQLSKLPADGQPWKGGFIPNSQADECAAQACYRCYCLSIVTFENLNDLVKNSVNKKLAGFCDPIYKDIFLEAQVQAGTIMITAITNLILMAAAKSFSRFERYPTISATEATTAKYTFFSMFVNQVLLPIVLYSFIEALEGFPVLFQGAYTDFNIGWYNKVMVVLLGSAIINAVSFPLSRMAGGMVSSIMRSCSGACATSQLALNKLYQPAKYTLSDRYGQMMCVVFYTMIFFVAAPPLFPIAAVYAVLMYNVDKVVLLKFSKRPPQYDHKLNDMFLKFAPVAAWLHCAIATWAFGHHNVPSYIVDPGGYVKVPQSFASASSSEASAFDNGEPGQFDFMSRLTRANALLPFGLFLLLTVYLVIANFFGFIIDGLRALCCEQKDKVDDVAAFSDLIAPGDALYDDPSTVGATNKLSGLRSYRIEHNPDYMPLFPEVVDADPDDRKRQKRKKQERMNADREGRGAGMNPMDAPAFSSM